MSLHQKQPEKGKTAPKGLREALSSLTAKAKRIGKKNKAKSRRNTQDEVELLQQSLEEVLFFLRQKAA